MTEQANPEAGASQASSDEAILSRLQNFNEQFDSDQAPEAERPSKVEAEQSPATPQPEADAQELTVEDLPQDNTQADADAFEIVHNGSQVKLTRADTIKYAQQGFDYDRKTQALAEERRSLAERAKMLHTYEQMVPHLTQDKAQVDALGAELAKYQQVNWVQIAQQNPAEYPVLRAQYDQLMGAYQSAGARLSQRMQQVQGMFAQATQQNAAKESAKLRERIPAWRDADTYARESPALSEYMTRDGMSPFEIENLWDSRIVKWAYNSQKYEALQQAKASKVKQLRAAPPVTRPNAANSDQAGSDRSQQLTRRLQKTGDVRDAAALLMERWK